MVFIKELLCYLSLFKINYKNDFNKNQSTDNCKNLCIILHNEMTHQKQLNKKVSKPESAIQLLYLVRRQIPLKFRINLLKPILVRTWISGPFSTTLSQFVHEISKQSNWGKIVCFFRTKNETAQELLLKIKTSRGASNNKSFCEKNFKLVWTAETTQ